MKQVAAGAWDALEELDVHLQPMTRLQLLYAASAVVRPVLFVGRQPGQAMALEDPMHRRGGDQSWWKRFRFPAILPAPKW